MDHGEYTPCNIQPAANQTFKYTAVRKVPKTGRNAPCPCGSGKKYKKCCLNADTAEKWPEHSTIIKQIEEDLHGTEQDEQV